MQLFLRNAIYLLAFGYTTNMLAQNVGIATANPDEKLHIVGEQQGNSGASGILLDSEVSGLIIEQRHSASNSIEGVANAGFLGPLLDFRANNGVEKWSVGQIIGLVDAGANNYAGGLAFTTGNGGNINPADSRTQGNTMPIRMLIQGNGDVGIGTVNPLHKFHVFAPNGAEPLAFLESDDDVSLRLESNYIDGSGNNGEVYLELVNTESNTDSWKIGMNDDDLLHIGYTPIGTMGPGTSGNVGHELTIHPSTQNDYFSIRDFGNSGNGRLLAPNVANEGSCGDATTYFDDGYFSELYRDTEFTISDRRTKKNIQSLTKGLEKVMALRPVRFDLDIDKHPFCKNLKPDELINTQNHLGFIAQELKEVMPELVRFDDNLNYYSIVNYEQMIAYLTLAIQEQQVMMEQKDLKQEQLEKRIEQLEKLLN